MIYILRQPGTISKKQHRREFSHYVHVASLNFYVLVKIGVFYIIFYLFLAGWFAGLLHAFYITLDHDRPTWYGDNSLIQNNPGKFIGWINLQLTFQFVGPSAINMTFQPACCILLPLCEKGAWWRPQYSVNLDLKLMLN